MNLLQLIKKEILITVLSIVIIVSFFGLITYAYFMDIKETDLNVIKYGDIELTFCADTSCDNSILNIGRVIGRNGSGAPIFMYPQTEAEALATVPYIFKLSNTGDLGLDLTIRLEKEDNPTLENEYSDYTPADDTYIYTAFGVQGEDPVVKLYTELEDGSILLNLFLEKSETRIFNLWTWLKEDAPNEAQGTYFIADISIKGEYKPPSPLFNQILADNTAVSDSGINFDSTDGNGLYYTSDNTYGEDNERIYYYRGRIDNNWVSFGGYLWRIVRSTNEKGIKLTFAGDGNTNTSAFINSATKFNNNNGNKYYVGYTYNTNGYTESPQTNSVAKTEVDNWYNANLSSYSNYLSTTAIYCADRAVEREYGSGNYSYPARDRLGCELTTSLCYNNSASPTFDCSQMNASRYTVSEETGNGYLTNPIALLSADEIVYGGIKFSTGSLNSYLMDNATGVARWWTMSPFNFYNSEAFILRIYPTGSINDSRVSNEGGIRPTISLKSCITVSEGNGNKSTPYVLSDKAC